jgi:hypothetical protein
MLFRKNKIIKVVLIAIIVMAGFSLQKNNGNMVLAVGESTGINGYAWSDNIGWVQMGGYAGSVKMDLITGNLSGFAWSDNIGWINFAPVGPYPSAPNYSAKIDLVDGSPTIGQVSGWAQVVSLSPGGVCSPVWAGCGWITMQDTATTPTFGVKYDVSPTGTGGIALPQDINKWAWSDDLGWLDFSQTSLGNMTIIEAGSDYSYTDRYQYPNGIIVNTHVDLGKDIDSGNASITKGESVYYTLEISNQNSVSKNIDLKFLMPSGYIFIPGSVTCTIGVNPCGNPGGTTEKVWTGISVPSGISTVQFRLST